MGEERFERWNAMTVEEFKAYLGFCVLMCINQLPALDDYWRRDPTMHYATIANRISRDRFREITRFLHFADDSLVPRGSGMIGWRPLITYLSECFAIQYRPRRNLAVAQV